MKLLYDEKNFEFFESSRNVLYIKDICKGISTNKVLDLTLKK